MDMTLSFNEKVVFTLRQMYQKCGYSQYKMSKFEEYDLYAKNKDFLISDSVITFTDTNGKLLALKPDVTLSIIKNSKDIPNFVQKVYYNENVYRVSKGTRGFKEIMQVGLECFGDIDDYNITEVITLAAKSLQSISQDCILDISHLGLLSNVLDSLGFSQGSRAEIFKCISEKNMHELEKACADVEDSKLAILKKLIQMSGEPDVVLSQIGEMLKGICDTEPVEQLSRIVSAVDDSEVKAKLHIDFSVVDDINYYNGIVFKGFIKGIPTGVLAGGQYDKLMQKMKRKSGAIGFAVYLDLLGRLDDAVREYDVDIVLLYEKDACLSVLNKCVSQLIASGNSVMAQTQIPKSIKYKQLMKIKDGEVEILENNA